MKYVLTYFSSGQGTLLFKNGDKYEGEFQNDHQDGFGTHWVCEHGKLRLQYRGGFHAGKREGQGVFAYKDGGKYEGEWQAGKRHGQGKMIYSDQSVYEGAWMDGKRHGAGTFFVPNGDVFQVSCCSSFLHSEPSLIWLCRANTWTT